ncbi:MAG: hypothetical protein JWR80_4934, partial [Bradyrhizobium sp.]|nr:hypothetical protein [Bradyrhizobium sp.]
MISSFKKVSLGSVAVLAGALLSTAASAQSTRTWVSGVGDDVNPCSRTAPCKTFSGALANTLPGGEINCLDAGGFGTATITQAVSIICDNVEAGVLVGSGVDGITVSAGANDVVILSGLDIQGIPGALTGIRLNSAGGLRITNTRVRGFTTANSYGVTLTANNVLTQVFIENVTVSNNGSSIGGGGLLLSPQSNSSTTLSIKNALIQNNSFVGMRIDTVGKTNAGAAAQIDNGTFSSDSTGLIVKSPFGTGVSALTVINSTFQQNVYGVSVNTTYA